MGNTEPGSHASSEQPGTFEQHRTFEQQRTFALAQGVPEQDLPRTPPPEGRHVLLDGAYNLRDVGGLAGPGGTRVTRGQLFRSDHLNELTDRDLATIARLGVRTVYDFRLDSEVERQPSRIPSSVERVVRLAAADGDGLDVAMVDVVRDMLAGRRPLPSTGFWDENYRTMLQNARAMFVGFVAGLAAGPGVSALPALCHCTGGKDRTGIATSLVLELLGVDGDAIVDDFLLTNVYRTPHRVVALRDGLTTAGVNVADAIPVLGVSRSAITVARAMIADDYGGAERYLLDGGLDLDAPRIIRDMLLEPAS